jgi:L,D-transpeptidase ErfK/SrfK
MARVCCQIDEQTLNRVGAVPRKRGDECAAVYELPADGSAVVGTDSRISLGDQEKLFDVARRYGLGYPEIVRANPGADTWAAGGTQEILLPVRRILPTTPHEGVVIGTG